MVTRSLASELTFGSLFSGIGGFDLGFERAGMECRWQVEIDPFCLEVLAKHWPDVKRYKDVTKCGDDLEHVNLICGGFPCQDISFAGYGAGLDGERSGLWREMVRIIRMVEPRYVVVENVSALLARGMGIVLRDLAELGYDAEWDCFSACSFGAPHVRRRVFVVAYPNGVDGWPRVRNTTPQPVWPLQKIHGFESSRASWAARMENPSALYGGSDGLPRRMDRNRALGNAIVPRIAEWIGRRIVEANQKNLLRGNSDRHERPDP